MFWNKGEVCSATSSVLVERSLYPALMTHLKQMTEAITIGVGDMPCVKLGPVVSKNQNDQVMAAIEAGKANDATLITGGRWPNGMDVGHYIAPTIFADIPTDAAIWNAANGWPQNYVQGSSGSTARSGSPHRYHGAVTNRRASDVRWATQVF